jgi:hypothetical protein
MVKTSLDSSVLVSAAELRGLLADILVNSPSTCVRFRLFGELWQQQFMRIVHVTSREIILRSESTGQIEVVPNIGNVVQFEIDTKFRNYQPHFHYEVWLGES